MNSQINKDERRNRRERERNTNESDRRKKQRENTNKIIHTQTNDTSTRRATADQAQVTEL